MLREPSTNMPSRIAPERIADVGGYRPATDLPRESVLRLPDGLAARYDRLILAENEAQIGDTTPDTLVLACDWLFWRRCVETGRACLHIESVLGESPFADIPAGEEWYHAMRWVWDGERDRTRVRGLSLGNLMWRDATMFAGAYQRLRIALEESIRHFGVQRVDARAFHDYYGLVPPAEIHRLLRDVAAETGVALDDRTPNGETVRGPWGRLPQRPHGLKETVKRLMSRPVGWMFRLRRWLGGRRSAVFLLHNPVVVRPLLETAAQRAVKPMLVFQHWPKTPRFLIANWWRGVFLAPLGSPSLDAKESAEIDAMLRDLDAQGWNDAPGLNGALWRTLRTRQFTDRAVRDLATRAKAYRSMFRSWGVSRVVVGDISGLENRIVADVAADLGIPVDELPNGVFLCRMRHDPRETCNGAPPTVHRGLAWSRRLASMMTMNFTEQPIVVTGYPPVPRLRETIPAKPGRDHWLILPILIDADDVRGLHTNGLVYAVGMVRALNALGRERIRLKMHPAHAHQVATYRAAMDHFGLTCEIVSGPSLIAELAWADHVIGPVNSGAWVETLAGGRDFYPVRGWPSSTDVRAFTEFPIFETPDELAKHLRNDARLDREAMLAEMTEWPRIADPVAAFWDAIEAETTR